MLPNLSGLKVSVEGAAVSFVVELDVLQPTLRNDLPIECGGYGDEMVEMVELLKGDAVVYKKRNGETGEFVDTRAHVLSVGPYHENGDRFYNIKLDDDTSDDMTGINTLRSRLRLVSR